MMYEAYNLFAQFSISIKLNFFFHITCRKQYRYKAALVCLSCPILSIRDLEYEISVIVLYMFQVDPMSHIK